MKQVLRATAYFLLRRANSTYGAHEQGYRGLGEDLSAPVAWAPNGELPRGELYERYSETPGAHKWHHYFDIYDSLFRDLRNRPMRILEIGVYKGASLTVWRDYFHPDSTLVGVDIDEKCAAFDAPERNVHVRIGSQQDKAFLDELVDTFGPFDLVIDDGSHMTSHMIDSFNHLFRDGLKDGGLYVAEDTHTNFWETHRDSDLSFLEFCFQLVNAMHAHYDARVGEPKFRYGEAAAEEPIQVPLATTLIQEVRFWDSIVAVAKKQRGLPLSQHW